MMRRKDKELKQPGKLKNELTQQDIIHDVKSFADDSKPHPALETAEGKNNGAQPTVFKKQQPAHP